MKKDEDGSALNIGLGICDQDDGATVRQWGSGVNCHAGKELIPQLA